MIDVLYEDNHCLVVNKPAGILSQGDATGDLSVVDWAADDLKRRYAKPGAVYIGLVHRLDRPTSGVLLLARTSKAAARLAAQFADGSVEKRYWAVIEGGFDTDVGELIDGLRKDAARNVVDVVPAGTAGSLEARLEFRVLGRIGARTWLEVRPITGRSHQIRAQLAARGRPIVGDRKYGAKSSLRAVDGGARIALHARELTFEHPTRRVPITIVAPTPDDWPGECRES
ncbi:MAG: RNA pseudouridine synthase [Planctomycetota bacterium]|nr:RNA pseudouridine synthase [Planctomycetota bacterium]